MAFLAESIGTLGLSIGLHATGMAFGIIGLLLGVMRSTTKNKDHWAILFSAFAWVLALIIPTYWAGIIFVFGSLGLTIGFTNLIKDMGDKNIFVIALVAGILNLILLTGTDAYDQKLAWQDNYDSALNDIESTLSLQFSNLESSTPEYRLCQPNSQTTNTTACQSDLTSGEFIKDLFMPFASILTIGTYVGKAVAFMGMATLAPLVLGYTLDSTDYFSNSIITILMSLVVTLWQIGIFYKLVAFVLNKRGMK